MTKHNTLHRMDAERHARTVWEVSQAVVIAGRDAVEICTIVGTVPAVLLAQEWVAAKLLNGCSVPAAAMAVQMKCMGSIQ